MATTFFILTAFGCLDAVLQVPFDHQTETMAYLFSSLPNETTVIVLL
jgi:hypothetical protein